MNFPVGFHSRQLKGAERRYKATELEVLADGYQKRKISKKKKGNTK